MITQRKGKKIVFEIYRELFKNSTPAADFDELYENAEINEDGRRVIDFMAYEIDKDKFEEIMNGILSKYKMTEWERRSIKHTVYLGCSPKYKDE